MNCSLGLLAEANIKKDDFLTVLNVYNLYDEYKSHFRGNVEEDSSVFQLKLNKAVRENNILQKLEEYNKFLLGDVVENVSDNPIILYHLNNNHQSLFKTKYKVYFTNQVLYSVLETATSNKLTDVLDKKVLSNVPLNKILVEVGAERDLELDNALVALLLTLMDRLDTLNNQDSRSFEEEVEYNYLKSLDLNEGSYETAHLPITSASNLVTNTELKNLINNVTQGLVNYSKDNLASDLETIEDKNYSVAETEVDPYGKVSAEVKLLLRDIPKYINDKDRLFSNLHTPTWDEAELLYKIATDLTDRKINIKTKEDFLNRLERFTVEHPERNMIPVYKKISERLKVLKDIKKQQDIDYTTVLYQSFQKQFVSFKTLDQFTGVVTTTITMKGTGRLKTLETPTDVTTLVERTKINNEASSNTIKDILEKYTQDPSYEGLIYKKEGQWYVNNSSASLKKQFLTSLKQDLSIYFKDKAVEANVKYPNDKDVFLREVVSLNNEQLIVNNYRGTLLDVEKNQRFPLIDQNPTTQLLSLVNKSSMDINKNNGENFFEQIYGESYLKDSIWNFIASKKGANLGFSIADGISLDSKNTKVKYSKYQNNELAAFLLNIIKDFSEGSYRDARGNHLMSVPIPIPGDKSNLATVDNISKSSIDQFLKKKYQDLGVDLKKNNYFRYLNLLETDYNLYLQNKQAIADGNKNGISINLTKQHDFNNPGKGTIFFLLDVKNVLKQDEEEVFQNLEELLKGDTQKSINYFDNLFEKFEENLLKSNKNALIEINLFDKVGEDLGTEIPILKLPKDSKLFTDALKDKTTKRGEEDVPMLDTLVETAILDHFYYATQVSLLTGHLAFYKKGDKVKRGTVSLAGGTVADLTAIFVDKKGQEIQVYKPETRILILEDFEDGLDASKNEKVFNAFYNKLQEDFKDLPSKERKEKITKLLSNLFYNNIITDKEGNKTYYLVYPEDLKEDETLTGEEALKANAVMLETKPSNTTDAASYASPAYKRGMNIWFNEHSHYKEDTYQAEVNGTPYPKNPDFHTTKNNSIFKDITFYLMPKGNPFYHKTSTDNFDRNKIIDSNGEINPYMAMIGSYLGYEVNFNTKEIKYNPNKKGIVDKITFTSAIKADKFETIDLKEDMKDPESSVNKGIGALQDKIVTIPTTKIVRQQHTPEHLEGQGTVGTQILKLLNNVIYPEKDYIFNGNPVKGDFITNLLNDTLINLIDKKIEKAGLTKEDAINDFLYELLADLMDSREGFTSEKLTPEKTVLILRNYLAGKELAPKIASKLKKLICDIPINAFSLFNGTLAGDDSLNIIEEDGKIIYEIAMPLFNHELHDLLYNEETGEYDLEKLPKEVKDMVVYRIPSEALYSSFVIRIKKLLPPNNGAIIYMPKGTTNIAGFDMDIDKLFGMMNNYRIKNFEDKNGNKTQKIELIKYSLDKNSDINFKEWVRGKLSPDDKADLASIKEIKIEEHKDIYNRIQGFKEEKEKLKSSLDNIEKGPEKDLVFRDIEKLNNKISDSFEAIKQNIDYSNEEVKKIFEKYKETFIELELKDQLSLKQNQNILFDLFKTVVSSPESIEETLTGNNFDKLKKLAEDYSGNVFKYGYELRHYINTFSAVMSGAKNIGIAAMSNTNLTALGNFNRNLKGNFITYGAGKNPVNINLGKKLETLVAKGRNVNNEKINLESASFLAQAVDNIKNPIVAILNLYPKILPNHLFLYNLGLDPNLINMLFKMADIDKIIDNGVKKDGLQTNPFFLKEKVKLNDKQTLITYDQDGAPTINIEGNLDFKVNTMEELEAALSDRKIDTQTLLAFLHEIQSVTQDINTVTSYLNIANKGVGNNLNLIFANMKTMANINNQLSTLQLDIDGSYIKHQLNKLQDVATRIFNNIGVNLNDREFQFLLGKVTDKAEIRNIQYKEQSKYYEIYASTHYLINLLRNKYSDSIPVMEDRKKELYGIIKEVLETNRTSYYNYNKQLIENPNEAALMLYNRMDFKKGKIQINITGNNNKIFKDIVNKMSIDSNTFMKYKDEFISNRDFINMIYEYSVIDSLLFSNKSKRGFSNPYAVLFMDNLLIQSSMQPTLNLNTYNHLINKELEGKDTEILTNHLIINNDELYKKNRGVFNGFENDNRDVRYAQSKLGDSVVSKLWNSNGKSIIYNLKEKEEANEREMIDIRALQKKFIEIRLAGKYKIFKTEYDFYSKTYTATLQFEDTSKKYQPLIDGMNLHYFKKYRDLVGGTAEIEEYVKKDFENKNLSNTFVENMNELRNTQKIYNELGNKTKSENIVIKSWNELKDATSAITSKGIIATRIKNTNEHFGNPFSHDPAGKTPGLIKTETIKEAVEKFTDWVINKADVILPIGTSGSGKSTFIKSLPQENLVVIEPDAMRVEFTKSKVDFFTGFWNRQQVAAQTDKVFLFGDNTNDRTITKYIPSMTQAVIRGLTNAIGIDTKKDRGTSINSYFTDDDFDTFKQQVDEAIQKAKDSGKIIVIPADGIGTGKAMLKEKAPKLFKYLQDKLSSLENGDINDKSKDKEIYEEAANRAIAAIKQGKQVVFDTTNLTKDKRTPFIEAIKKALPNANIQYKLMELNPELAKQRIKADIAAGKNRANVPDSTIDRHAESYTQMLEDIKFENITSYDRAEWIREQLNSGKLRNQSILYYKELGEPSHATALDYLINKYDWDNEIQNNLDISTLLTNGLVDTEGLTKINVKDAEVFTKQVFKSEEADKVYSFIEKLYDTYYDAEHKKSDKFGRGRRSMYFSDKPYTYSGVTRPLNNGNEDLRRLISKITTDLGFEPNYFDMVLINEYKDGSQKIGFHTDNEPILNNKGRLNPSVVTISFGDERTMILKNNTLEYKIPMISGMGLIMGKNGQTNYKHGIEAEDNKSKRFSITLRHNAEKSLKEDKKLINNNTPLQINPESLEGGSTEFRPCSD